jgi:hypothetical protein
MPRGCVRVVDTSSPWPKPAAPAKDRRSIAISFAMRANGLTRQADCDPLFGAFATGPRTPTKRHETPLSWTNQREISGRRLDLNFHPSWHDDSNETIVTSNDAGRTLRRPVLRVTEPLRSFRRETQLPPRRGGRPSRCPTAAAAEAAAIRNGTCPPLHRPWSDRPDYTTVAVGDPHLPRWPRRPTGTSPNERWRSVLPAL